MTNFHAWAVIVKIIAALIGQSILQKMNLEILKEKCTLNNLKIYFKTLLNLKKVKMIDAQLNLMKIKSVNF